MKITKFSQYSINEADEVKEEVKEEEIIRIKMSADLYNALVAMKDLKLSKLYGHLYRGVEKKILKDDYVNYLNLEEDGNISFLKQRYNDEADKWKTARRDRMKANRAIKLIIKDEFFEKNINQVDIENFSNRLTVLMKPLQILELRGEEMLRAFNYTKEINMDKFGNSCANFGQKYGGHAEPHLEWYDIYIKNPENMAAIVAFDKMRIVGRRTIQQGPITNKNSRHKDKIFTFIGNYYGEGGTGSKYDQAILKYIKEKWPFSEQYQRTIDNIKIKIENTKYAHYPPFDGMQVNFKTDELAYVPPGDERGGGWYSTYKVNCPREYLK